MKTEMNEASITYTGRPDCNQEDGKAFLQHQLKTVEGTSSISCARQCRKDGLCISFNHNMLNGSCQLNWDVAGEDCSALSGCARLQILRRGQFILFVL